MTYCKNYIEEREVSTSQLNEVQKTLYYIAENMRIDKSISEEGYRHFQTAIRALEQESILDKVKAEIEDLPNANPSYWYSGDMVEREDVLEIIDKYREGEE